MEEYKDLKDPALITLIKENNDSAAMTELVNRHTGIYFGVVQKYAATYPSIINYDDLKDDKMFNIYRFVTDYDPSKNTKFSTYIHDRAEWLCKGLLKDDGRPTHLAARRTDYLDAATPGTDTMLTDTTATGNVEKAADKELSLESILTEASAVRDKRFVTILRWRHFHLPAPLTWREIGAKLSLTHERARQIYNEHIDIVRRHLTEKAIA